MLADLTVAKATTGVGAPAVSVGSGNSRPMREDAPGRQRPTGREEQPAVIPIVRDECVHFQSEACGDAWINATETVVLEDAR